MQKENTINSFSGERVQKAGKQLRNLANLSNEEFEEMMNVLSYWRRIHEEPLHRALTILQDVTRRYDKHALFAKRMKRADSIYFKLARFDKMGLHKMQDIGGCRAIIKNVSILNKVLNKLKKLPQFKIRDDSSKINNYILNPKPDGYRSVHIIGKFPDSNGKPRFIEVQLRTPVQHYWATSVEIVDLFTRQSIKTNQGDETWSEFFKLIGDQFAIMDTHPMYSTLMTKKQYEVYIEKLWLVHGQELVDTTSSEFKALRRCNLLINELDVIALMSGFAESLKWAEDELNVSEQNGYALIIINLKSGEMRLTTFPKNAHEQAEASYVEEEKKASKSEIVVAMVATPNIGGLKAAYPNFFADSTHFLEQLIQIQAAFKAIQHQMHKEMDKIWFPNHKTNRTN